MRRFLLALAALLLCTGGRPDGRAAAQHLTEALRFAERPSGKSAANDRKIDASQHLPTIDFESLLVIEPDTQRLHAAAATDRPMFAPLSVTDQVRLDTLDALLQAARAYVEEAARVVALVEEARRSGAQLSEEQIQNLQQQISRQAELSLQIKAPVKAIAEARAGELHPDDEDAFEDVFEELTDPIFEDEQGNPVILNVAGLAAFLREHLDDAERQIEDDADIAARQGTARFRMRAWLHKPGEDPVAIGIAHYDEIENMAGPKRSRVAFRLTPSEQKRLAQGLALSGIASQFIKEVRDERSTLRTGLDSLHRTARRELAALQSDSLQRIDFAFLQSAIHTALASPLATPAQKNSLRRLDSFLQNVSDIQGGLLDLKAAAASSPAALVQQLLAFPHKIAAFVEFDVGFADSVQVNLPHLDMLRVMPVEEATTLRLETLIPQTTQTLNAFIDEQLGRYAEVAALLNDVVNRQRIVKLGNAVDHVSIDPRVRTLALDNVRTGAIDLDQTPADQGDRIHVRAELITTGEDGGEEVLDATAMSFRVQRFGFTSEVGSHLIFADRARDDSTQFQPAPSASWTLHYRPRTGADASFFAELLAFFDPGVGLNVAGLDFDDANFQIGVGAHTTLFNDLLVVGYGYNLQASTKHEYAYLGIGLLEALDSVGGLFGSAAR